MLQSHVESELDALVLNPFSNRHFAFTCHFLSAFVQLWDCEAFITFCPSIVQEMLEKNSAPEAHAVPVGGKESRNIRYEDGSAGAWEEHARFPGVNYDFSIFMLRYECGCSFSIAAKVALGLM